MSRLSVYLLLSLGLFSVCLSEIAYTKYLGISPSRLISEEEYRLYFPRVQQIVRQGVFRDPALEITRVAPTNGFRIFFFLGDALSLYLISGFCFLFHSLETGWVISSYVFYASLYLGWCLFFNLRHADCSAWKIGSLTLGYVCFQRFLQVVPVPHPGLYLEYLINFGKGLHRPLALRMVSPLIPLTFLAWGYYLWESGFNKKWLLALALPALLVVHAFVLFPFSYDRNWNVSAYQANLYGTYLAGVVLVDYLIRKLRMGDRDFKWLAFVILLISFFSIKSFCEKYSFGGACL
jgi:hypothetical protein